MGFNERVRFVTASTLFVSITIVSLTAINLFSLELFIIISCFGFVTIAEVASPDWYAPQWQEGVRWMVGIGLLVFTVIVIQYTIELVR